MSWAVGYDSHWKRDIGYGVPSICDHPECNEKINRGLSYVCGNEPKGGEHGCGLYFCEDHLETVWDDEDNVVLSNVCEKCANSLEPFKPKPDTKEWIDHKLTDESWSKWREENPEEVEKLKGDEP